MKYKRFLLVLTTLVIMAAGLTYAVSAAGAEPAVIFNGDTKTFAFQNAWPFRTGEEPDLFADLKGLMPGDRVTQQIIVSAKKMDSDKVWIYLRSENPNEDYTKLVETYGHWVDFTVRNDDKTITGDLKNGVLLGIFENNDKKDITVELSIDIEAGNELQNMVAEIDWVFTADVVPKPDDPDDPDNPELDKGGDHLSYIIGYPDGTVQPLGTITRAEVATIFFRLLTDESRAYYWSQSNPFTDVAMEEWYNNAISTMYKAGVINGYPDGSFRPNDPVSRAEFAAIATRFHEEGRDGVSQKYFKQYFKDVNKDDWYATAIELAYELGWAQGYEGNYRPEDDMTRAEVMTMVNRIMEREVKKHNMLEDMIHWPDNTSDKWYYEAVQEATNSHTYVRTKEQVPHLDFFYEIWKKLLKNPNWAALERIWSEANSQH